MFNLQLNVYTAAISSVNKIVINEWLKVKLYRVSDVLLAIDA